MREYGKEQLTKESEWSKEFKVITKKRRSAKNLKYISSILTAFLLGTIISNIVYSNRNEDMLLLYLFVISIIWSLYCLAFPIICKSIIESKKKKVRIRNGFRLLTGDKRRGEESLFVSSIVFLVLVWLTCNRMLLFDREVLILGLIPIIINVKLIKLSTSHKEEFINKRELYNESQKVHLG